MAADADANTNRHYNYADVIFYLPLLLRLFTSQAPLRLPATNVLMTPFDRHYYCDFSNSEASLQFARSISYIYGHPHTPLTPIRARKHGLQENSPLLNLSVGETDNEMMVKKLSYGPLTMVKTWKAYILYQSKR